MVIVGLYNRITSYNVCYTKLLRINNQDKVIKSVVDKIKNELPEVIINYDLQEDKNYQTINDETIKKLIGFSSIYIHIPSKESSYNFV